MKITVHGGEAFPVYSVYPAQPAGFTEIDVSPETIERWRNAFVAFSTVQLEIIQTLKDQGKEDQIWFTGDAWDGFLIDEDEQ